MSGRDALRELDALVAERVMGLRVETTQEECSWHTPGHRTDHDGVHWVDVQWVVAADAPEDAEPDDYLPAYSTDIADAWEVVDALGGIFTLKRTGFGGVSEWYASIAGADMVWADTPALAICRAALAAVDASRPDANAVTGERPGLGERDR
jgi:hypothetical protein